MPGHENCFLFECFLSHTHVNLHNVLQNDFLPHLGKHLLALFLPCVLEGSENTDIQRLESCVVCGGKENR